MKTNHHNAVAQRCSRFLPVAIFLLALMPVFLPAQTPVDEDAPWPRVRSLFGPVRIAFGLVRAS